MDPNASMLRYKETAFLVSYTGDNNDMLGSRMYELADA